MRPTVYEAMGGAPALERLTAAHHERCLRDPVLEHPFSHGQRPDHLDRLAAYWGEVFGGPPRYSRDYGGQTAMLTLHSETGAQEDLPERFLQCFLAAIDDAELPADPELRAVLRDYMSWAVQDVHSYAPKGSRVPGDVTVPRWSWDGLV